MKSVYSLFGGHLQEVEIKGVIHQITIEQTGGYMGQSLRRKDRHAHDVKSMFDTTSKK